MADDRDDRGDSGDSTERVRPPPEPLYTALWVSYRDGVREKSKLKRMHRVSWRTVNQAIEHGWPEKEWPSFRDRLLMWERQKGRSAQQVLAEADRRAAEAQGQAEVITWLTFQPQAVKVAADTLQTLRQLGAKLQDAVKAATFVRYRKVRTPAVDAQGQVIPGRFTTSWAPYVDGMAMARACQVFSSAFKETSSIMSFLMGGPNARVDFNLPDLTPEQLEQLRAGEVPEGLTVDQVARLYVAGMGGQAAGGQ